MKMVEKQAHIRLDDKSRAWIDDTNVKVIEVVLDHLGYGWNAETIQENHPHLSLAQVRRPFCFAGVDGWGVDR
jgi:hypothetical protein